MLRENHCKQKPPPTPEWEWRAPQPAGMRDREVATESWALSAWPLGLLLEANKELERAFKTSPILSFRDGGVKTSRWWGAGRN